VTAPELQRPHIKINPALANLTLGDVLDVIVKVADTPIAIRLRLRVVFSARKPRKLFMREFKLDRSPWRMGKVRRCIPSSKVGDMTHLEGGSAGDAQFAAKFVLGQWGGPESAESVYYKDRIGFCW